MSDQNASADRMRQGAAAGYADLFAVAYLAIVTLIVVYLVQHVTTHPFMLAFVKFALLATFGECLRRRIGTGTWIPDHLLVRAVIWGCFGIWIAVSFMVMNAGIRGFMGTSTSSAVLVAFTISIWMNVFSGYGFFMMLTHYILDRIIDDGIKQPADYFSGVGFARWLKIVSLSLIFFWTPAHTITFLLPTMWRIVFAAYLGIALGGILSFATSNLQKLK